MSNEKPEKKSLKPMSLVLRSPIPSGSAEGRKDIERTDGGWCFGDVETGTRYWVPDGNIVCVVLG